MAVSSGAQCGSYAVVARDRRKASTRCLALLDSQPMRQHSNLDCLDSHPVASSERNRSVQVPARVRTCSLQRLAEQGVNPPSEERSSVMRRGHTDHEDRRLVLDDAWDDEAHRLPLANEGWRERATGSFDRSQILATSVPPGRCSLGSLGNPAIIQVPRGFDLKIRTLRTESCGSTLRLARINSVIRLDVDSHRTSGSVNSARCESSRRVQAAPSGLGTGRHG